MNASGGFGFNLYPSNTESNSYNAEFDANFNQVSYRTGKINWIKFSLLANYGFEYRTKKDGYFYLGASFDRPFNDILYTEALIERSNGDKDAVEALFSGAYITIDFRYFFHESPERKKKRTKR